MSECEYDLVGKRILTNEEYEEACRAANEYSVSLINGNDLKGSATLVSIGSAYGLLRADHVWQFILRGEDKGRF